MSNGFTEREIRRSSLVEGVQAPRREFKLLVDGVSRWLEELAVSSSAPTVSRCFGLLVGAEGSGAKETLSALGGICRRLNLLELHARADGCGSPGVVGQLVGRLQALAAPTGDPAKGLCIAPDVLAELQKVSPGCENDSVNFLPALDAELERSRLIDAVSRGILDLSTRRPVVIALENFDALDPFSAAVFAHLVRMFELRRERDRVPRILIVASLEDVSKLDHFLETSKSVVESLTAFRVESRGYSRGDLQVLAGDESAMSLSVRERVLRRTGGHVMHIRWLLAEWRARCAAGATDDPWEGLLEFSYADVVRRRLDALPPATLAVVRLAAVLREVVPRAVYEKAGEFEEIDDVEVAIDAALRGGWLRVQAGAEIGICDGYVSELIVRTLARDLRSQIEEAAADALESAARNDGRWFPHVVRHATLAGSRPPSEDLAYDATLYLSRIGCAEEALELIDELLAFRAGETPATRWKTLRANLMRSAGELRSARSAYEELLPSTTHPTERARLALELGQVCCDLGDARTGVESFALGLEGLTRPEPSPAGAGDTAAEASLADVDEEAEWASRLESELAMVRLAAERDDASELVEFVDVVVERLGLRDAERFSAALVEAQAASTGETWEARPSSGATEALAKFRTLLAESAARRGEKNWEDAEKRLLDAGALARRCGSRSLLARVEAAFGRLRRARGEGLEALHHLDIARGIFRDLNEIQLCHRVDGIALIVQLEMGRFARIRDCVESFAGGWPDGVETLGPNVKKLAPDALGCDGLMDRDATAASTGAGFRAELVEKIEKAGADGRASLADRVDLVGLFLDLGDLTSANRSAREILTDCRADGVAAVERALEPLLLLDLGRAAAWEGRLDESIRYIDRSLLAQARTPNRRALLAAYRDAADVRLERADLARSYNCSVRGLQLAIDYASRGATAAALSQLAGFFVESGAPSAGVAVARAALDLAPEQPRLELTGRCLLGRVAAEQGERAVAARELSRAETIAERMDLPVEAAYVTLERGWERFHCGAFTEALRLARRGIEFARSGRFYSLLDDLLHLVGAIESAAQNPGRNFLRALDVLEQALAATEQQGRPRATWDVLQTMASAYSDKGKHDVASGFAERAASLQAEVTEQMPTRLRGLRWRSRIGRSVQLDPTGVRDADQA